MNQSLAAPPSALSPATATSDDAASKDAWRRNYGSAWRLELAFMGLVWFLIAALRPLSDPDLPMHLATGEWVVRNGAVPFTEPFAWTRPGAPYYAYSWAINVVFYGALVALGPLGLRLLNGLIMVGVGAATLFLGRQAGWHPRVVVAMAYVNMVFAIAAAALRPQLLLLVLVPLAWGLLYRIREAERLGWQALGLVAVNAAAANTHIFFPLMAAPCVLLFTDPPRDRRWVRWAVTLGAVLVGWMLSPYALQWPEVFRFTFEQNALSRFPTPIAELTPGFVAVLRSHHWQLVPALALALLPWGIARVHMTRRQRLVAIGFWLVGLVGFAIAVRLLMVWWLLVLPLFALVLAPLGRDVTGPPPSPKVKIAFAALVLLAVGAMIPAVITARQAEGSGYRRVSSRADAQAGPVVEWLESHTKADAGGKIFTAFNFGSYLVWRLPQYSSSIDGRGGIFPDSVAGLEAFYLAWYKSLPEGAWRSADVAILPLFHRVSAALDTSATWKRAAYTTGGEKVYDNVGLWVQKRWWDAAGRAPLPDSAVNLSAGDSTRMN